MFYKRKQWVSRMSERGYANGHEYGIPSPTLSELGSWPSTPNSNFDVRSEVEDFDIRPVVEGRANPNSGGRSDPNNDGDAPNSVDVYAQQFFIMEIVGFLLELSRAAQSSHIFVIFCPEASCCNYYFTINSTRIAVLSVSSVWLR